MRGSLRGEEERQRNRTDIRFAEVSRKHAEDLAAMKERYRKEEQALIEVRMLLAPSRWDCI